MPNDKIELTKEEFESMYTIVDEQVEKTETKTDAPTEELTEEQAIEQYTEEYDKEINTDDGWEVLEKNDNMEILIK